MMRVLIVDDEPEILETTAEILELDGFEVKFVQDYALTLATMRSFHPDLVLHDAKMPGLVLKDQFQLIRADPDVGDTPIVVFTATIETLDPEETRGADGFIEKPFDPLTIAAQLAEFEGQRHSQSAQTEEPRGD